MSVLWARIQILEEKQNNDILDKYFPHPSKKAQAPTSAASGSSAPVSPSCTAPPSRPTPGSCSASCPDTSTCYPSSCFHHQHFCSLSMKHSTSCSNKRSSENSEDLVVKVNNILNDIQELKSAFNELKSVSKGQQNKNTNLNANNWSSSAAPTNSDIDVEHESSELSSHPNLNASVATVEEFIPDISDSHENPSESLNLEVPTIQLQ